MEKISEAELIAKLEAILDCKLTAINQKLIELNSKVSDFNDEILKAKDLIKKVNQAWLDFGGEASGVKNAELVAINNQLSDFSRAVVGLNDLVIDFNAKLGTMSKELATTKAGLKKIKEISVEQVEKLGQKVAEEIGKISATKTELDKSFEPILEKLKIKVEPEPKE